MRKVSVGIGGLLLCVSISTACLFFVHIHQKLGALRREVAAEGMLPFEQIPVRGFKEADGATQVNTAFVPLSTPDVSSSAAEFQGKLFLGGPGGLAMYDQPDAQPKLLRAGIELPSSPITSLAVGHLRGEAGGSLVASMRGEGLLLFGPDLSQGIQLRPKDPAARDVTSILPLTSGDLLIGTREAGLLVYDGNVLRRLLPALAGTSITALAGSEGDVWIGTRDHGAFHWQGGQLTAFDQNSGMPDAQIEDIVAGGAGVFVGTPLGVAEFNDGRLTRVLAKGLFAHSLALDGDTLLVATVDEGIRELPLRPEGRIHFSPADANVQVARFLPTADGVLALSADGSLLRRENDGVWRREISPPTHSLADRNVASLAFAPDGRLWIGYFDRGVDVLDLETARADHFEDDHLFCINRIVTDPQRLTIDVATANGLVLFDPSGSKPRVRQVLSRRDGLISDQITDVAFTRSGAVVATPAGITFLTPLGAQSVYAFQGLVNNHVYTLSAPAQSKWVVAGTLGGISLLDDQGVRQNISLRNSGLKRNWVTALAYVPGGNEAGAWFVGTYGGGVMRMEAGGDLTAMDSPAPDAVINPNAMLVTPQHVFAGSLADGLLVYDGASRRWSQIVAGLPSRNVTALTEREGELYIGTDNGIVHISERSLP